VNYRDYVKNNNVKEFVDYFISNCAEFSKSHWFPEWRQRGWKFSISKFDEAIENYSWPSTFKNPAGYTSKEKGSIIDINKWPETQTALSTLSSGLKKAIDRQSCSDILDWSSAILQWGMGAARGEPSKKCVENLLSTTEEAVALRDFVKKLDSPDVNYSELQSVFPDPKGEKKSGYMSSGISKIISLSSREIIILGLQSNPPTQCQWLYQPRSI